MALECTRARQQNNGPGNPKATSYRCTGKEIEKTGACTTCSPGQPKYHDIIIQVGGEHAPKWMNGAHLMNFSSPTVSRKCATA